MTLPVRHRPGTPPRHAPYRSLPVPGGTAGRGENVSASLTDGLLTVTVRLNEVLHPDAATDRYHSVLVVVGSPPERNGIVVDLQASIIYLTLTTINVTDGLLRVTADNDHEWARAEQSGRQGRVTTTAGPLR
ncbi:hypothetical protein [Kitasatospora sp. NPDC056531]|uniref:hypothetical protein n=1 Tax=Kitasatospora sp. NPDC056531 TaxID=3345856 RepID=UPI0036760F0F